MSAHIMPGSRELTPRQAEVLAIIEAAILKNGFSPSVREIMVAAGVGSPNGIMCHIEALHRKGWITYQPNTARSIRLTGRPQGPVPDRGREAIELLALATCGHLPGGVEVRVCFKKTGVSVSYTHGGRRFHVGPEIGALDPEIGTVLDHLREAVDQARMFATAEIMRGGKRE